MALYTTQWGRGGVVGGEGGGCALRERSANSALGQI